MTRAASGSRRGRESMVADVAALQTQMEIVVKTVERTAAETHATDRAIAELRHAMDELGGRLADMARLTRDHAEANARRLDGQDATLADLRERLAFLRGNRKAALAWSGLILTLLGGGVGALVTALAGGR